MAVAVVQRPLSGGREIGRLGEGAKTTSRGEMKSTASAIAS